MDSPAKSAQSVETLSLISRPDLRRWILVRHIAVANKFDYDDHTEKIHLGTSNYYFICGLLQPRVQRSKNIFQVIDDEYSSTKCIEIKPKTLWLKSLNDIHIWWWICIDGTPLRELNQELQELYKNFRYLGAHFANSQINDKKENFIPVQNPSLDISQQPS